MSMTQTTFTTLADTSMNARAKMFPASLTPFALEDDSYAVAYSSEMRWQRYVEMHVILENMVLDAETASGGKDPNSSSNSTNDEESDAMSSSLSEKGPFSSSNSSTIDENEFEEVALADDNDFPVETATTSESEMRWLAYVASKTTGENSAIPEPAGLEALAFDVLSEDPLESSPDPENVSAADWINLDAAEFVPGTSCETDESMVPQTDWWNYMADMSWAAAACQYNYHYQWAAAMGHWAAEQAVAAAPAQEAAEAEEDEEEDAETAAPPGNHDAPHFVSPVPGLTALQAALFAVAGPPPGLELPLTSELISDVTDVLKLSLDVEPLDMEPMLLPPPGL